jgi:hypothetical protein
LGAGDSIDFGDDFGVDFAVGFGGWAAAPESVKLLDGGRQTCTSVLETIDWARRSVRLQFVGASSRWQRWLLDPFGRLVVRMADTGSRVIAGRRRRLAAPDHAGDAP